MSRQSGQSRRPQGQPVTVSASGGRQAHPWLITLVLGCGGIVVSLEKTAVVPLLPEYPRIFGVSSDDVSWLVTVTLLSAAVATPVISRLADMFGKKRMLLLCLVIMVAGGLIASIGGSFTAALVGRALQGCAGAVIPVGISILRDTLPQGRVAGAVSLMSASFGIGSALGLPMSGFIYEHYGWQATFWVVALIGLALVAAVAVYVPKSTLRTRGRFDYTGAVLLSGAMTALLLAITKGGVWGWGSDVVLGLFAACAVLLLIWFPLELRSGQPLLDLRTSARRPVLLVNIGAVLVGFSMYANMLVTTQQLQLPRETGFGFGLTVLAAGLAMIPAGLAMVAVSPVSARLTNTFGAKVTMVAGCAVMAAGYLLRVFLVQTIPGIILGATVISVGTAMAMAAMPTIVMSNSPRTDTAAANGLNTLLRSVGTSTCSAAVAAILASVVVDIGGRTFPGLEAFRLIFIFAGSAAAAAAAVCLLIPKPPHLEATHPDLHRGSPDEPPAGRTDIVVGGRLLPGGGRGTADLGTVTVTDGSGAPVDWDRSDADGKYAVALPGPGRYIFVAAHVRWQPVSEVLDFPGTDLPHDIRFRERLLMTGRITRGGAPATNALVLLVKGGGDPPSATRSDRNGGYELPLPAPGRYILTVVEDGGGTHSRRIQVPGSGPGGDIELGPAAPQTGLRL